MDEFQYENSLNEQEWAQQQACHDAARLFGIESDRADACEDGAECCPACPFWREAGNWKPINIKKKRAIE